MLKVIFFKNVTEDDKIYEERKFGVYLGGLSSSKGISKGRKEVAKELSFRGKGRGKCVGWIKEHKVEEWLDGQKEKLDLANRGLTHQQSKIG